MRPGSQIGEEDLRNEIRVINKLCLQSTHRNLVLVLRHGILSHSSIVFHFIDMELCDWDLDSFIQTSFQQ